MEDSVYQMAAHNSNTSSLIFANLPNADERQGTACHLKK